jgi:hypothetical protein
VHGSSRLKDGCRHDCPPYKEEGADATLDLNQPIPLTEEEDEETLAAIERGIRAADEGRTVPIDEVRKMIPTWISRLDSRNRR